MHTEKMGLAGSLGCVAEDTNMIISGEAGQKVLGYYTETLDEIGSRNVK